jgi:hypothetical protein
VSSQVAFGHNPEGLRAIPIETSASARLTAATRSNECTIAGDGRRQLDSPREWDNLNNHFGPFARHSADAPFAHLGANHTCLETAIAPIN